MTRNSQVQAKGACWTLQEDAIMVRETLNFGGVELFWVTSGQSQPAIDPS